MLSLSLLLISLLAGTSVASPVSFDYNTFDFDDAPTPPPGLTLLDASNQGLGFYPSEGGEGGGGGKGEGEGVPDFTVPLQQPQQQQIDYYLQQPQFAEFKIAEGAVHDVEEPDSASCTKVCCEGHYGEILTFSTGQTGFDYVNRCSPRPSTFFGTIYLYASQRSCTTPPLPSPQKNTLNESSPTPYP